MKTFNLEIFKGHPIIRDYDNIILIDTGAPSTIHKSSKLLFMSTEYDTVSNYLGLTVDKLSDMLGENVTTLLGADILSNYKILFDYRNEQVSFDNSDINFEGKEIQLSSFMSIPIIELNINQQNLKFFLDTGAKLSFLSDTITANYVSVGKEEDFYPGVGNFETKCYDIGTNIGDDEFQAKYGNLPELLQMTLMLAGTDGIIGYDFFKNYVVMLDLKNSLLKYRKNKA